MTVTIEENGILGPVDGISEKDEAVANKGATIFIVLKGQAVAYVKECEERK